MGGLNIDKIKKLKNMLNANAEPYAYFIESGTCFGETTMKVHTMFEKVYTIELHRDLYDNFKKNIDNLKNINIESLFGDSYKILPLIFTKLDNNKNTVFWLDGHYSGGGTAQGEKDCPLIEECSCIDLNYLGEFGLVIIDDLRLFETHKGEDWTNINKEKIRECFKNFEIVKEVDHDDMMAFKIKRK